MFVLPRGPSLSRMQKRLTWCSGSLEYKIGLDTQNVSIALKTRLATSMPVVIHDEESKVFEKLEQSVTNHNFVIHKAPAMDGFSVCHVENMTFLATFLEKNGKPNKKRTSIWVSGNLMNDLICHKLKKYKFVYDETLIGENIG